MQVVCPNCHHEFQVNTGGGIQTPIRDARREKGLTVAEAAEQIGISPFTLQTLERGKMNPRLSVIRAACRLYEKSVDELFPDMGDEEAYEMIPENATS